MSVFERILWRVLRGNLFMNSTPIDELIRDPVTGEVTKKNVFIIFAQGKHLLGKIRKIADSMGATLYPVERNPFKRRQDASETAARIQDLNNVLYNTNQTRMVELRSIVENIASWDLIVKKEKAIYYAMNTCSYDQGRRTLLAEGWIPTASVPEVQSSLRAAATQTGSTVSPILSEIPTNRKPPTFFRTNKFTAGFQTIVDSYGVARYGEVNPGLFTIITFPFLFAVMFGDLGHGAILTLIGLALTVFEARLEKYKSDEVGRQRHLNESGVTLTITFSTNRCSA
jgi:V-type H+-transporting ATPase subunit a